MTEQNGKERRKHTRFSATAFLNRPVRLTPLPPFFGRTIKGRLIDLSAGGLSVLIKELLPPKTFLHLCITLPDNTKIENPIKIVRVLPRGDNFLHGIEFQALDPAVVERIDRMSTDFINCENRIQAGEADICRTSCAFYTMCNKKEKIPSLEQLNAAIELAFRQIGQHEMNSTPLST